MDKEVPLKKSDVEKRERNARVQVFAQSILAHGGGAMAAVGDAHYAVRRSLEMAELFLEQQEKEIEKGNLDEQDLEELGGL